MTFPARAVLQLQQGIKAKIYGFQGCWDQVALYAPAIALGMFERALHFFPENFREDRSAYDSGTRFTDVWRTIAASEDAVERLFHPICFEGKAKGIPEHHCRAKHRADRIGGVASGQGRRRAMNGLKKR